MLVCFRLLGHDGGPFGAFLRGKVDETSDFGQEGNHTVRKLSSAVIAGAALCTLAFCAPAARAQEGIETGDTELRIWTGGGAGLNRGTQGYGVWNAGVRYGWVITNPMLPGRLRGRFEYAVDFVPVFAVFQPGGVAHGISFNPVNLKWIFDARGRIVPYTELDGGVVFSTRNVPPGTSTVNFTTATAFGAHFLNDKFDWSTEIRFTHFSNAALRTPNPGINSLEVRIGFGLFRHHNR